MSRLETIKCPNCGAPLEVDAAAELVKCEYCRAQSSRGGEGAKLEERLGGPRLAETVSFEFTEDIGLPLLESGAILPVTKTELLGTSRDDQDSFDVKLRAGNAERPVDNRLLGRFSVPLAARGPRGTVMAGVTFHVAADGSAWISVKERGVDDAVRQDGLSLAVTPE